ncbi:DUF5801 repeats-in-toxin domain-containing protein, partial [Kiloniella majae]|uniref:DUF5801 repeats-in-toxin domain-containing protein n=1 Tax=Kiloniella majae TaxID=1938558 RepID=UPI001C3FEF79
MTDDIKRNDGEAMVDTNDVNVVGETGRDVLVGQAAGAVDVSAPGAGETVNVSLVKGQSANLNFDATAATPVVEGNDFVLTFDSNGDGEADSRIVFQNLVEESQGADAPVLIIGGVELSAGLLIGQAQALAEGETLETAAGAGAGPAGGGGSVYSDDLGSAIDLLNAQGVIDPTELQFGLLGGQDEITDPAQGTFTISFITTDVEGPEGGISGTFAGGFEDALPNQHLDQGDIGFDDDPFTSGELYAAPMQVQFNFTPSDNETLDSVEINALPADVELYIGGFSPANLYTGGFPVTITPEDFDSVFILPPKDSDEDILVSGQANISDPDSGESATLPFSGEAIIDAVADVPLIGIGDDIISTVDVQSLSDQNQSGGEGGESDNNHVLLSRSGNDTISEESTICVPLNAALRDVDGSEVLSLEISGVPEDFTLLDGYLPSGWTAVAGEAVDGLVTYTITYTAGDPLPTSINGVIAFDTNDYTTENPANPGTGRDADGEVNTGDPVNLTVTAIATEQETDVGTDELTLENNVARASETFTFDITEDVPEVSDVSLNHDETEGKDSGSNDKVIDSDAATLLFANLDTLSSASLGTPVGWAQVDINYNLKSDGSGDEVDGSDGTSDTDAPVNTDSSTPDDLEDIRFASVSGAVLKTDGGSLTSGGVAIELQHNPTNPEVVWGVANGVVIFAAYIDGTLNNEGNSGTVSFVQYGPIDHPDDGDGSNNTHDEAISFKLEYQVVDDEGDVSTANVTFTVEDDGPSVDVSVAFDEETEEPATLSLNPLDESTGADASDANADSDDTGNTDSDPTGANAIGSITSGVNNGALGNLFNVTSEAGTDGEKSVENKFELTLGGVTTELGNGVLPTEANGVATNLNVTQGTSASNYEGTAIYLFLEGGEIVGRFDATSGSNGLDGIAFRISLDDVDSLSNADLTFDQYVAIDHPSAGDGSGNTHDEPINLLTAGENGIEVGLKLTTTVTDGDDDTATDSATVVLFDGQNSSITIEDDGPSITSFETKEGVSDKLTLDESVGVDVNDNNAADEETVGASAGAIGYAKVSGADLIDIAVDAGTDGEKSREFSLQLDDQISSGLFDTESGQTVVLSQNGDVITGTAGGETVFTITVDPATGGVTVEQFRALKHSDTDDHDEAADPLEIAAGAVKLTVTVTDGDDDTDSESVELGNLIKFEDDGPTADLSAKQDAEIRLDETENDGDDTAVDGLLADVTVAGSTLFTNSSAFGSDGAATSNATVYSLTLNGTQPVDSGLVDAVTDEPITLSESGGVITGSSATGGTVFTVSIDPATGAVTVQQSRAIEHDDSDDHDESTSPAIMTSGLVEATVTVTDGDGDSHSDDAELGGLIKFEDDGPSISANNVTEPVLTVDETVLGT